MKNDSLMKVKVLQNAPLGDAPLGAFCNTFDLHLAIIGLENQFSVFLRVAILHRFFCIFIIFFICFYYIIYITV